MGDVWFTAHVSTKGEDVIIHVPRYRRAEFPKRTAVIVKKINGDE